METSNTKMGIMKPVIVKAGIPLAITIAGFAFARIVTGKSHFSTALSPKGQASSQDTGYCGVDGDEGSIQDNDSDCCDENTAESALVDQSYALKEEILRLKSKVEDIQHRELRLETRFLCYQELKNQETAMMELHYKFLLEIEKVELCEREISTLEAENRRFESMIVEYVKVLGLLGFSRSRNERLHKRIKKLLAKNRQHFHILRKQCMQIEAKETEISRNQGVLEEKDDRITKMIDEMREMKLFTEQLLEEKNDLLDKLRVAEQSAKSKEDEEIVAIENYNQLRHKLGQLEKDKTAAVQESIYLKWSNACLRQELMIRRNQEHMEENKHMNSEIGGVSEIEEFGSDNELNTSNNLGGDDSRLGFPTCGLTRVHVHSKRRRLIAKFKNGWKARRKIITARMRKRSTRTTGSEGIPFLMRQRCIFPKGNPVPAPD